MTAAISNEETVIIECEISTYNRHFSNTMRAATHVRLFCFTVCDTVADLWKVIVGRSKRAIGFVRLSS